MISCITKFKTKGTTNNLLIGLSCCVKKMIKKTFGHNYVVITSCYNLSFGLTTNVRALERIQFKRVSNLKVYHKSHFFNKR